MKINQESRYFCQTTKYKGLGMFPFKIADVTKELEEKCPTLCSSLQAIAKPGSTSVQPRVWAAAMLLLNTRNKNVNAFQKLISILLWKGQLKSQMFRRLRLFGLSIARGTVLNVIDKLAAKYDTKANGWRRAITEQEDIKSPFSVGANYELPEVVNDTEEEVDEEEGLDVQADFEDEEEDGIMHMQDEDIRASEHDYGVSRSATSHEDHCYYNGNEGVTTSASLIQDPDTDMTTETEGLEHLDANMTTETEDLDQQDANMTTETEDLDQQEQLPTMQSPVQSQPQQHILDKDQLHPGYQVVFDNVNIHQKRRHKTSQNQNDQHNLVQLYAVLDRVNLEHLPNEAPILPDVRMLGRDTWWLPARDQQCMKSEIQTIIERVLVDYIPCLKPFKDVTKPHILHQYSSDNLKKSEVNKLGLLRLDEMRTGDMINIMDDTQEKRCPRTADGKVIPIPLGVMACQLIIPGMHSMED
ncbi:uncharacterized protein [Amphiura filiformis]|uniref:uncharacterized protein isoform X2 n=1 Tax=Amphiura filiformis TaxID=82378 RepID=UPI003B21AC2A